MLLCREGFERWVRKRTAIRDSFIHPFLSWHNDNDYFRLYFSLRFDLRMKVIGYHRHLPSPM
jgi:hypothetical protein